MKRTIKSLAGTCMCLFYPIFSAASISSGANQVIDQVSPTMNIGIEVVDLTTGTTLFQRNENKFFIPASNMKLYSDAAALMALGPDYQFKNTLSTISSQLQQGVLKGSLYLNLPGDPSFTRKRLELLLTTLKDWPISRIQGNVIIDSSHSMVTSYAPGVMQSDHAYSYGAPIAPVMVDANRIVVTVNPASQPGQPALIEVDDDSGTIILNNQVITKDKSSHCNVDFSFDSENHLTVRGCVLVGQWAVQQKMSIRNPLLYAQGLIKQTLKKDNIILDGQVLLGKNPPGAMLLGVDTSKPISQLMADTLKPSDNLYADSLFLHAAYKLSGRPVNWNDAEPIIKRFLQQQTSIPLEKSILIDGSGLSRNDRVTPSQTVGLLRFLYNRFPLSYEYISALPISGRDGTLQRRFKRPDQQDLVRAKTGTMSGVVSLSGYLYTANDHTLAFAIFINRLPSTKAAVAGRSRYLIDALCSYFLQQKPGNSILSKIFTKQPRIQYQLNPTQNEQQRGKQAKWRRLEVLVKQALIGQEVTVVYRGNELVLQDKQVDGMRVLHALQNLHSKYPFAVALATKTVAPNFGRPFVFLMEDPKIPASLQRVWTIREST